MSSVGFANCEAMALIGQSSVLSTACPRKRNLSHTCWINFFPLVSSNGADNSSVAYCFLAPYLMGTLGYGACCFFVDAIWWNCFNAFLT